MYEFTQPATAPVEVKTKTVATTTRTQFITAISVISVLLSICFIISGLALNYGLHQEGITQTQETLLQSMADNVEMTSAGCVVAKCFNDAFGTSQARIPGTFSASQGNVECETLTLGGYATLAESTGFTLHDSSNSVHVTPASLVFGTLSSPNVTIDALGIQSTQSFSLDAPVKALNTWQVASFTQVQREALSPEPGTIVYDTTLNTLCVFQDSAWFFLSNSTGVLSVSGTDNLIISGTQQNPIIGLSETGIVAGVYTCPTVEYDITGRAVTASSNSFVQSVNVVSGQLVKTGTSSVPVLGLPSVVTAGSATWPSLGWDAQGRIISASSNPGPVASVSGTSGQIVSTGSTNPVLSIQDSLLSSIEFWQDLEPSGTPLQSQFLQYQGTALAWTSLGSSFPSSRNVYVDKSGNDTTGNGSSMFPFLTVKHAVQVVLAGDVSDLNQVGIFVGAGMFVESNPIVITKPGINIIGCSPTATWLFPIDATQEFIRMDNGTLNLQSCLFQVTPGSSSAACISTTGTFSLFVNDCSFRFFQTGMNCTGNGISISSVFANACLFVQNNMAIACNGLTMFMSNSQIIGNTLGDPDPAYNGLSLTSADTLLFIAGGCYFISCGTGLSCANGSQAYLGNLNFTNNTHSLQCATGGVVGAICCNFVRMNTGHIAVSANGNGSKIKLNACSINGLSDANAKSGTGLSVTNDANVGLQACNISNTATGIKIGTEADSASTICICSNSEFEGNLESLHLYGTSTFVGTLITVDNTSTMIFESVTNVKLVFSSITGAGINIGTLSNVSDINLIGIGTKLVNPPSLMYKPDVYNQEELVFVNPDPSSNTATGVISQENASMDILSIDINGLCGVRMYSDLSGFDGNQIRGWNIFKNENGQLSFEYKNNITGQSNISKVLLQLDAVSSVFNLFDSKLAWTGANLYEVSPGVLQTDTSLIIGSLTSSRVVVSDANKKLVSSAVTSAELGFVSGVTSSVQTQLNSKVNKAGDTMTGALASSFVGSASVPSYGLIGAGLYSSQTNHLNFATNNANRVDINETGDITVVAFGTGIVKSTTGLLSSSLIYNADITSATIQNAKLATVGSTSSPGYIVTRDNSEHFETKSITLLLAPVSPNDAANKQYVDTVAGLGLSVKDPVRVVSVTNVAVTGLFSVDSIALTDNNRVLLVMQTDPVENGAWLAHSGAWTRPADFASGSAAGLAYFLVTDGVVYIGSAWVCSTPMALIGTDDLVFSEFSLPQTINGDNVGTGSEVFKNALGSLMYFRTLVATNAFVQLVQSSDEISIGVNASDAATADTIVIRDALGGFSAVLIVADLDGHASEDLSLMGGTLTGALTVISGTEEFPGLVVGAPGIGIWEASGALQFSVDSKLALSISSAGVTIVGLSTGVLHSVSGALSSSKIVDDDITPGTILNTSLAHYGSGNVGNDLVMRDISGNFAASMITASLTGNVVGNLQGTVTGHASLDLLLSGGILTGPLQCFAGSLTSPGLRIGDALTGFSFGSGALQFLTNSAVVMSISSGGGLSITGLATGVMHTILGVVSTSQVVASDLAADAVTTIKILDTNVTTGKIADLAVSALKLAPDAVTTVKILDANVTTGKIADSAVTDTKLATDAVTTLKIVDLNVTTGKLADSAVTALKLSTDAVTTLKILDANVTTGKLADLAVTAPKLATDSVTTLKIVDLNVTTGKLADSAVTALKLAADAVTTFKILDANVTTSKILDLNVTTVKLADSAVTALKLATDSVTTLKILDANVTTAKILDLNVTTGKLADSAVTAPKLATDAVTTLKILDLNVTTGKLADSAVTALKLATDAVTTLKILDANVTTAKILDLNVTTGKLADSAVTALKLATDSVTTIKILDANVTTSKILDLNVTTGKLADSAITALKLASDAVTTIKILDLNVTSAKINDAAITTVKILDLNVTTAKIADGAVTDAKITGLISNSKLNADTLATANTLVLRDANSAFSAGSITSNGTVSSFYNKWESSSVTTTTTCASVCFNPVRLLYWAVSKVSGTSAVMSSPTGATWTNGTSVSIAGGWACVASGLGVDVAVAALPGTTSTSGIMYCLSGSTWVAATTPNLGSWTSIVYAPEINTWCCVANAGASRSMSTVTGPTTGWTGSSSIAASAWSSVCWSPSLLKFVAVSVTASTSSASTSLDGITWVSQTTPNIGLTSVCWSTLRSCFVAVGASSAMYSTDGITWTPVTTVSGGWTSVVFQANPGRFVACANTGTSGLRLMWSPCGKIWSQSVTNITDNAWQSIAAGTGMVVVGNANTTMAYYNGIDFSGLDAKFDNVTALNPMCGLGLEGALVNQGVITSNGLVTNAKLWLPTTVPATQTWVSCASSGSLMLAVSSTTTSNVMSSIDGSTWIANSLASAATGCTDIVYAAELGIWVIVSGSGAAILSATSPLSLWTTRTAPNVRTWASVAFLPTGGASGIFVAIANLTTAGSAMLSSDGLTWSNAGTPSVACVSIAASRTLGLFAAVSSTPGTSAVMTSPTGAVFTTRTTPNNSQAWTSITFGRTRFVAVANAGSNRVMTSTTGITWTANAATPSVDNNAWLNVGWMSRPGLFVAVGTNCFMVSPDGLVWTVTQQPGTWVDVCGLTSLDPVVAAVISGSTAAVYKNMTDIQSVTMSLDCVSQNTLGSGVNIENVIFSNSNITQSNPSALTMGYSGSTFTFAYTTSSTNVSPIGATMVQMINPNYDFSFASTGLTTYNGSVPKYFSIKVQFSLLTQALASTITWWISRNVSDVSVNRRVFSSVALSLAAYVCIEVEDQMLLVPGDQIMLAGRVASGTPNFTCQAITYMLRQL